MSTLKKADHQMSWEVVTEGVTSARLEAHRLHQMIHRVLRIVDLSGKEEEIYEQAGDLMVSVPERIKELERVLDRTSYALSKMGQDTLRNRLPASDRTYVEETSRDLSFLDPEDPKQASKLASRVAGKYLEKK